MKTVNISGFGNGYEETCQVMLTRALKWYVEKPRPNFQYSTLQNVMGLCIAENPDAKELDKVMIEGFDVTGAMHQCVVSHFGYITKHGYKKWLDDAKVDSAGHDRLFERDDKERALALKRLAKQTS